MRSRSFAFFLLSAALVIAAGDLTPSAAQEKKNKKAKAVDAPATPTAGAKSLDAILKDVSKPAAPPVAVPNKKDPAALAKLIDAEVNKKLAADKVPASPRASDEEFLRRAYLDIVGVIPGSEAARAFLDSTDPQKRERLIDQLLADERFGRRMADLWTAKLFPKDSANRFVAKEPLHKWFEAEFNKNEGWDKLTTKLVTATGTVADNPAVSYFMANRSVDKLTDTTAQHFLGIQLQCAQCHNHPFTSWKQTEYWAMATFYSKVKADNPKNANKGGDPLQNGVQEGPGRSKGKDFFPEAAKNLPAKFLGGPEPALGATEPFRPALAKWMTAPGNPFFAKALVNRTWAHLFGRGFVNPVDDMLPENEASHPELLAALAAHVATTGEYDLKYLLKAICLSDAYQRTSKPTADNKADTALFSHMTVKVMSPEQLYDSLGTVTLASKTDAKQGKAQIGAAKGVKVGARDQFVNFFLAGAETVNATEYEAGIPQALRLMNSNVMNNPAAARAVVGGTKKPEEAIERIYLAALSRRPTATEVKNLTAYVARVGADTAYSDILWAVLNSSEFTLVR